MKIGQLVAAESGWKAVFKEPDGAETMSRILGWAAVGTGEGAELVGVIVDPSEPSRIVAARDAGSPGGGSFARYRYVAPEPPPPPPPPAPPPAAPVADAAASSEGTAEQLAKSFLKRRR